jgi:hypothetical protein
MKNSITNCFRALALGGIIVFASSAQAQTDAEVAKIRASRPLEVPHSPPAGFDMRGTKRVAAELVTKKSIEEVRLMYMRTDANAILNLDAKPIAEVAVAEKPAVAEAPAPAAKPTLQQLKMELKAQQNALNAARLDLRAAARAKDADRKAEASAQVKASQSKIVSLKKEIKALEPKKAVIKKKAAKKVAAKTTA